MNETPVYQRNIKYAVYCSLYPRRNKFTKLHTNGIQRASMGSHVIVSIEAMKHH